MVDIIATLIDKQDNFEVVRDQIALILATETASQQALAFAAAKDPKLFEFDVFTERFNPWEQYQNNLSSDKTPIVNVWFDTEDFPPSRGNVVEKQIAEAVFNIDCYGCDVARNDPSGGHFPADESSRFIVHRIIRLVRNILMAALNTHLQLKGTVVHRWFNSITVFQPEVFDDTNVLTVSAARLALAVHFVEVSPQIAGVPLEFTSIDIKRAENGSVLAEVDIDYT